MIQAVQSDRGVRSSPLAIAPPFPQTGWHPAQTYWLALGMERRAFMANLKKYKVPHRKCGDVTLIQVQDFIASLPAIKGKS